MGRSGGGRAVTGSCRGVRGRGSVVGAGVIRDSAVWSAVWQMALNDSTRMDSAVAQWWIPEAKREWARVRPNWSTEMVVLVR